MANCKVLHKQKRGIPFSSHISQRRLSLSHCQLFSHIRPFISRKCFSPTFAVSDYNDNNIPVLSTHRPTSFPHLWLALLFLPSLGLLPGFPFTPSLPPFTWEIFPPSKRFSHVFEETTMESFCFHFPENSCLLSENSSSTGLWPYKSALNCPGQCSPGLPVDQGYGNSEQHILLFLRHRLPQFSKSRMFDLLPTWPAPLFHGGAVGGSEHGPQNHLGHLG